MRKILNIGMPRTGNHSLMAALKILGLRVTHSPHDWGWCQYYDAATEVYFPIDKLVRRLPDALFILTVREEDSWLRSCQRILPYVKPDWNPFWCSPRTWRRQRRQRRWQALRMVGETGRLLIFDLVGGEGWEPLYRFLGLPAPVPIIPFPNADDWPRSRPERCCARSFRF